jgi:hypothetical protein
MYKAIFYQDLSSFNSAKKSNVVVESVEPFLCIVTLEGATTPGTANRVKNTLLFSDIENIPTNRAIIRLGATGGTTNEAANAWLLANKVTVIRDLFNFGQMIVEIPKGSFASFVQKIQSEGWLSTIEQDVLIKAEPCYAFTYDQHWHLANLSAQQAWNAMDPYASNISSCGEGSRPNATSSGTRNDGPILVDCCDMPEVALLDEGVQINHPDLFRRIGTCGCSGDPDPVFAPPAGTRTTASDSCTNSWNIVNNNNNVQPQLTFENHGTAMAGIISGNNLNNNYTLSVSNNYIKTQVLRLGYRANAVGFFYTTPSWALEATYRASANPSCAAIVIPWVVTNLTSAASLEAVLEPAFDYITTQARDCTGIPIFAAAGNSNSTVLPYPAVSAYTLAIGASDSAGAKAYFSNKGGNIFAAAPGIGIRTTDRTGPVGFNTTLQDPTLPPNADINFTNLAQTLFNGTSASACIVAAVTACMRAVNPALTVAQIENVFEETSTVVADLGFGIINMQGAVQEAINLINPGEDLDVTVGINSISPNPGTLCGGLVVVQTEVVGSGDTWDQVTAVTLEYFASNDNFLTSNDYLLQAHTFPVNNVTSLYTYPLTIPNVPTLTSTSKLIVRAILQTNCGQIISNGATEFISSATGFTITTANCPGTDLAIEVQSVNYPNPGQRIFQVKYTNTGTVPITAANITRGWVGGASSTSTLTWTGTTGQTAPIQPGQTRIIQQSYNTPAPLFPGTFYMQINTVNNGTDFNNTNNYSTLIVNS